jgi:hypothetical protein
MRRGTYVFPTMKLEVMSANSGNSQGFNYWQTTYFVRFEVVEVIGAKEEAVQQIKMAAPQCSWALANYGTRENDKLQPATGAFRVPRALTSNLSAANKPCAHYHDCPQTCL